MKEKLLFWIVGGDLRQVRLAELLQEDGHRVQTYAMEQRPEGGRLTGTDTLRGIEEADCVVLPLPLMAEEGMKTTPNQLIHIGKPIDFDTDLFLEQLTQLAEVSYRNDEEAIIKLVSEVVPTYHYSPKGADSKTTVYEKQVHQISESLTMNNEKCLAEPAVSQS